MRPDDAGEAAEDLVEHGLQLGWVHVFGHAGEAPHVAEHDGHLLVAGLHAVVLGAAQHLVHQLGGYVGAEQLGQLAFGPAFHQVAIGHVEHKRHQHQQQRGGQGQHQPRAQIQPEVQPDQDTGQAQRHGHGPAHRHQGQQQHQGKAHHQQLQHLKTGRIVGAHLDGAVEQARQHAGVDFHPGVGFSHGGGPGIQQARRGGAHQGNLALQCGSGQTARQQVRGRDIGE